MPPGFAKEEALALLEIANLPRAIVAHDGALKRAPVEFLVSAPITPGKVLLAFVGEVAAVQESLQVALDLAGSARIDKLFLPGIHPEALAALRGHRESESEEPLAILEFSTAAKTLLAVDAALKTSQVQVGVMHLCSGFGGRGFFTLHGSLENLEAAAEAAEQVTQDALSTRELIAAPHVELMAALFQRPWALDPNTSDHLRNRERSKGV